MSSHAERSGIRAGANEPLPDRPMKSEQLLAAAKRIAPILIEDAEAGEKRLAPKRKWWKLWLAT